ncbi:hypothetical protein [Psychroflexus sp. ALD_RP9]|uniref:hypothetical protein n=1 Tax=Psychroflexus sp. ALD_RP9 TaxID=2777186 RepID=UPI001A8DFC35|nr:hypothetical protein [Psychroflexus sp. ALD_RP9]QSS96653.1 hypothetical protein IMZ30_09390 [Psychroflexus sp. ALD_RP9]
MIDDKISTLDNLKKLDSTDIYRINEYYNYPPPKYKKFKSDKLTIVITKKYEQKLQQKRLKKLNDYILKALRGEDILFNLNGVIVPNEKVRKLLELKNENLRIVSVEKPNAVLKIWEVKPKKINILINTYDFKTELIE